MSVPKTAFFLTPVVLGKVLVKFLIFLAAKYPISSASI